VRGPKRSRCRITTRSNRQVAVPSCRLLTRSLRGVYRKRPAGIPSGLVRPGQALQPPLAVQLEVIRTNRPILTFASAGIFKKMKWINEVDASSRWAPAPNSKQKRGRASEPNGNTKKRNKPCGRGSVNTMKCRAESRSCGRITSGSTCLRAAGLPLAFFGSISSRSMQESVRCPTGLSVPARALRPCSQVIHVLYGRVKESLHKKGAKSSDPISIKSVASGQLGLTGLAA
jgi:hypothetical protein